MISRNVVACYLQQTDIRHRQRHRLGLDACKAKFRTAWARIRAGRHQSGITTAHRYAENSAASPARYDARRRGENG